MDILQAFWAQYGISYLVLALLVLLIIPSIMESIKKRGGLAKELPACVYWLLGLALTSVAIFYVDYCPELGLFVHSWYGLPLHLLICWWLQKESNMKVVKRIGKALVAKGERKLQADLDGDGRVG